MEVHSTCHTPHLDGVAKYKTLDLHYGALKGDTIWKTICLILTQSMKHSKKTTWNLKKKGWTKRKSMTLTEIQTKEEDKNLDIGKKPQQSLMDRSKSKVQQKK